jgi:hypothetical protein
LHFNFLIEFEICKVKVDVNSIDISTITGNLVVYLP